MIEVHRGIEITLPQKYPRGSYHATVTINGRERWFHVNSRSFHNAEDNQYRDAVMAALSQRDDLLFYEYGPDGNKRYANLTHHSAELWQSICRNDVPTLQADDANILARWTQDGRIQSSRVRSNIDICSSHGLPRNLSATGAMIKIRFGRLRENGACQLNTPTWSVGL